MPMNFVPERLKELRLLNGYTLEMVARRIGVTKQAVSKYEMGKSIPATDVIMKIMDLYGISRGFLTNKRELPDERSIVFYRKNLRTPKRDQEEAEVYLKWFYEIITEAREIYPRKGLDLPGFPEGSSIKDKAGLLRQHWNLDEKPIEDIVALLEEHGFYFFTVDIMKRQIDGYSQIIGGVPIIVLNRNKGTEERMRFSIAHELGHLLLHHDAESAYDAMEDEADEFAGCFLMPEAAMRRELIRNDSAYFVNLAEKWKVSPQAVVQRYCNLQMLGRNAEESKAKAANLFQKLYRLKNWSVQETHIDSLCSIRWILHRIEADDTTAKKFLRDLSFPIKEIQRLCCWKDGFAAYGKFIVEEDIGEIEGVQLSLEF